VLTSNYVLNSSNAIIARIAGLSTSAIAEGTRLYYTDDRANVRAGVISAGSNVLTSNYVLNSSNAISTRITGLTTAGVAEDASRLYYTDDRANVRAGVISAGSNVLTSNYVLNSSNAISTRIAGLSTSAIAEGTRLYYTDDRANVRAGVISAGSNVLTSNYVLNSSNAISARINTLNTDTLVQGLQNKFIVNNAYNNNLNVIGELYSSILYSSKLNVLRNSLIYDFTPYTQLSDWKTYADSVGVTYNLNNEYDISMYYFPGTGWLEFQLPVGYDAVKIEYGSGWGTVDLIIDGIVRDTAYNGAYKTYKTDKNQFYVEGKIVRIQEDGQIYKKLKITFSKKIDFDDYDIYTSNYLTNSSNAISNRITGLTTAGVEEDASRLYYTDNRANVRAGVISAGSNLSTSNYILNSSNDIINYFNSFNDSSSNYVNVNCNILHQKINSTSNELFNKINETSNFITDYSHSNALYSSNYINNIFISFNDTVIRKNLDSSNYIDSFNLDLNSRITDIDVNSSNYILNTSNDISTRITDLNTAGVAEDSSRLYFTDIRADIRAGLVSAGSNILSSNYVLNSSNDISTRITGLNTAGVAEDSSRLYFTDIRADIRAGLVSAGSNLLTSNYVFNTSNDISARITSAIDLREPAITTLPVSKGGTGLSTITANQILYGNDTGALNISTGLTYNGTELYVAGDINATGYITASYSDMRLKTDLGTIENPIEKIEKLRGFYYMANDIAKENGMIGDIIDLGLSAQDVQSVLPEIIKIAPFDIAYNNNGDKISKSGEKYLTISYERLVPLLIEGIKELNRKFNELKSGKVNIE
jgi:hypothetical protein